jgi:hypothetical protein
VDSFHAYTLHANLVRFNGDRLHIDYIIGTLVNLRAIRGDSGGPLFSFVVELRRSPEDLEFFNRWLAVHGLPWPFTLTNDNREHHVLRGAFHTHSMYEEEWRAKRERRRRAVVEYNRSVSGMNPQTPQTPPPPAARKACSPLASPLPDAL